MRWEDLLYKTANEPVFSAGFLMGGDTDPQAVRVQLSRWVKVGRLIQLKRGLYTLAQPYRKIEPQPFVLANSMKKASYVSLQSALSYYGMIPEYVPTVTSVTTGRPEQVNTKLGQFVFRHIKKSWFCGYKQIDLGSGQRAFVAIPEKALLDLLYLTPHADEQDYLRELRLENLELLNVGTMLQLVSNSQSAKLNRAVQCIKALIDDQVSEEL